MSDLGERLKQALQASRKTQEQLADAVSASQSAVSQWLSGRRTPTRANVNSAALFLDVDAAWLESGEGTGPEVSAQREEYEAEACWQFRREPQDGGRDYGNANVWSFDPDIATLVREALQNSIDAALDPQAGVEVVFRIIRLADEDLARFLKALKWDEELRGHLKASASSGQKLGKLLRDGLDALQRDNELLLLRVDDFGTQGLLGDESGEGNFAALCRNNLDSSKAAKTSGGAFGLGKAVFWRASQFATVLFRSTLSEPVDGRAERLIGRADLAWHELEGSERYAGPGWYGRCNEFAAESYWDNEALTSDLLLERDDNSPGTSIMVIGFHDPTGVHLEVRQLSREIARATAENCWPAIASGQLRVAVEEHEGASPVRRSEVDPIQFVPEYADMLDKYRRGEIQDQLKEEGDVARRYVTLEVPGRKALDSPHPEREHDAIVLVRLADSATNTTVSQAAFYRGRRLVIKYYNLAHLCVGARPFHAAILCGEAATEGDADEDAAAAELFLRTAEPPAHNDWTSTPDLRTDYERGGKAKIDRFYSAVRDVIRELVRPDVRDLHDGPNSIKELFRIGVQPPSPPDVRLRVESAQLNSAGEWEVRGMVRPRSHERGHRVKPVLLFDAETGGGHRVKWKTLEGTKDCSADDDREWLVIPAQTREARFRAVSDVESHPLPAADAAILIELRQVEVMEASE